MVLKPVPLLLAALPLLLLCAVLLLAPLLLPWAPLRPDWERPLLPPGLAGGHLLGTDAIGRDVLALTVAAARGSLLVAAAAACAGLLGGTLLGTLAAWRGGWFERAVVHLLAVLQSLPLLLLAVLLLALFDTGFGALLLLLAAYVALDVARLARAEVRQLKAQPFCSAALALGLSDGQVLRRHVLPNLRLFAAAALLLAVPQAVLVESFLGFLGLGPGSAGQSLGGLLAEGMQDVQHAPWLLLAPATVMVWLMAGLVLLARRLGGSLPA